MNKSINFLLLLLAILISLSSCRKDDETIPILPELFVNGSVTGLIVNKSNNAISNVDVTLGNITTQTDDNGYFSIEDVQINERGSFITAIKDGYFHNSSFITSKLNGQN